MPVKKTLNSGKYPVKIWSDDLDTGALQQLENIAQLPIIHHHVAVMPDAHLGIGCTIGSVVPTVKAIIPAAVGVDIGCGMMAAKTNLNAKQLPDSLKTLREDIERAVPLGTGGAHGEAIRFPQAEQLDRRFLSFAERHSNIIKLKSKGTWLRQMGTLGSGNHFIEVCLDENQQVWIMLHSGSRGIGNRLAQYFIELAREEMRRHQVNLPDRNLAYLEEGSQFFQDYVDAVSWSQDYARINRETMMDLICKVMNHHFPDFAVEQSMINCHHNYVEKEFHFGKEVYVTRKGAIRAASGDWGIIPGSMGTRSFIVRGKGNPESFTSCSHGAGRRMSRKAAKRQFSMEDLDRQTAGVEISRRKAILDEIPEAYKNIEDVMANQEDLVEVVHTLKQVICVKGD